MKLSNMSNICSRNKHLSLKDSNLNYLIQRNLSNMQNQNARNLSLNSKCLNLNKRNMSLRNLHSTSQVNIANNASKNKSKNSMLHVSAVITLLTAVATNVTYCQQQQTAVASSFDASPPFDYHANMPVITKRDLSNAIKIATNNVRQQRSVSEPKLLALESRVQQARTWPWLVSQLFHKPQTESLLQQFVNITNSALISEDASKQLVSQFKLNKVQAARGLPLISVENTQLGRQCPIRGARQTFACAAGRYRSLSGHCNNVQAPDLGAAGTAYARWSPANYADFVSMPRGSGGELPSPLSVSIALAQANITARQLISQSPLTTMMSFFGLLVAHDISFTTQYTSTSGALIKCCNVKSKQALFADSHPECLPIVLAEASAAATTTAAALQQQQLTCLDYVRSTSAARATCSLGTREQMNAASAYLDASPIYGVSEFHGRRLRAFVGGRMRTSQLSTTAATAVATTTAAAGDVVELLPLIRASDAQTDDERSLAATCKLMAEMKRNKQQQQQQRQLLPIGDGCFDAGDSRANDNIGLTLMHTIWLREHNQIADKLAQINKHWTDERLFEEARRLVIAELQHITYAEFLPVILGADIMQKFNLSTQAQGYSQAYDPSLNGATSNEVATAALTPLLYATIPASLERYSSRLEMVGATNVADTFMDSSDLFGRQKFGQYLMGLMSQSAMEPTMGGASMPLLASMQTSVALNEHEARARRSSSSGSNNIARRSLQTAASSSAFNSISNLTVSQFQLDVVALFVQQGRDHGLSSYLHWRNACQLKPVVSSWRDLTLVLPADLVRRLQQLYNSVDDIDLYIAMFENALPGASVGPTLACLIARQFFNTKHADRYWFENDLPASAFSLKQLEQIRQTTLAKIICRNSEASISFIQPSPMLASDPFLNAYQYCSNKAMLSSLDLSGWREPITSAQQLTDAMLVSSLQTLTTGIQKDTNVNSESESEALTPSLNGGSSSSRARAMLEANAKLILDSVSRAKRSLDSLAVEERKRLSSQAAAATTSKHHTSNAHAGYRYLVRPKRQALRINNASLIFELATNDVVRNLVRQGRDPERTVSVQSDVKNFLRSLEAMQLDNLIDNSDSTAGLSKFIASAGSAFLTNEQRARLSSMTSSNNGNDAATTALNSRIVGDGSVSSSIFESCQDADTTFPCDHTTPFRTITGWCNNLARPNFGASFTLHDRILPSAYDDGFGLARTTSVTGNALPSARLVSTSVHDATSDLHARYSLALMQFGQFGVDHDLTRTPFSVSIDGSLLDCSSCDSRETVHKNCLPIEIPENDWFYRSPRALQQANSNAQQQQQQQCMHFVRSLNAQTALGPRQQMNALTSYVDASNIYGSDNCEAKSLRSFFNGRLNSSVYPSSLLQMQLNAASINASISLAYISSSSSNNAAASKSLLLQPKEMLPVTLANPECVTPGNVCFHAGDQRASEQPALTAMHTIFMRLHNSIVDKLALINKHWNDEKLYQTGRRIVGAISQRIMYNEFAPRLLGLDYMSKFDLMVKNVGYAPAEHYDEQCSASIFNEFAAAAFRMGHSLIRNAFPLLDKQYKQIGKSFQLRKAFFNSQRIINEPFLIDAILRGVVSTPIETLDASVTDELTNHLFEKPKQPFSGMDLISLNIQRAREHGIAPYNKYRVKCNLTSAKSFDDLLPTIPAKIVKRLSKVYASVDDIDLFTGGISELPVHGGIIGPTFACIIGMQFSRLKKCDRFWHETSDPFVRFSLQQLDEIRKITLAKVICENSDSIDAIQRNAMDLSDHYLNPRVACHSLPSLDVSVWRENVKNCVLSNKSKLELGASRRVSACKSCTCTLEGPICRTVKVDCIKELMTKGDTSSLFADKSCLVQCAWALEMTTKPTNNAAPATTHHQK